MQKNIYKDGYTCNRELSWLRFNDRVLNEAKDPSVPLLEKLKSVYFFSSNLEEFFRVRVGSLWDMKNAKMSKVDNKSGLAPAEQMDAIYPAAKRGCKKRDKIYEELRKDLMREGIEDLAMKDCNKEEMKFLKKYYKSNIAPLLNPQIVDTHHPFPNLQNHITYITADMKKKGRTSYCFVAVPQSLPQIIVLPHKKKFRFVHVEDLLAYQISSIFDEYTVNETLKLTVARSAYVDADDEAFEDILDYRKKMEKVLKERKKMNVTMLTVSSKPSNSFMKYLLTNLKITRREMFTSAVPMNMKYVFGLENLVDKEIKEKVTYPSYTPKLSAAFNYKQSLFHQVQEKDVLLHYPYESMDPFLQLVKEAANDPKTVSIKITIYRLATRARLVDYLCQAAENGKEVDVLIELKARFDEQNNIDYSEKLEDAGCNVIYGFERYKVHSKVCLITKIIASKPEYAALIATGNFNENTAKSYTDLAYITSRADIIKDVVSFFANMAIGRLDGKYNTLLVSPVSLKSTILSLMDQEIVKGEQGVITCKLNSITDEDIIERLHEASLAGVKVKLIVRGISCILPGIEGKTDNIEIISIVGRFLEHSRIYIFGSNENEKMYISSADFMTRNTERRVEVACPIEDAHVKEQIHQYLALAFRDNTKARIMSNTGRYRKINRGDAPVNSQLAMMRLLPEATSSIPVKNVREDTVAFTTRYNHETDNKKSGRKNH